MFDFGRTFDLQREIDRYLQQVAGAKRPVAMFTRSTWQPAVDVYETSDAVVALVDLAGLSQDEIDLVVGRNALTVRGVRRPPGPGLSPASPGSGVSSGQTGQRGDRTYSCMEIP